MIKLKLWGEILKMIEMRNLSTTEMINVNGGTIENGLRSFDTALTTIGVAIASWELNLR